MVRASLRRLAGIAFVYGTSAASLGAQQPAGGPPGARVPGAPGEIHGILLDPQQQPLGRGAVTVRRAKDESFAGGALVGTDGRFKVDGLLPGKYTLRITALGFTPFNKAGIEITMAAPVVDVGRVAMAQVAATLGPQVTTAERSEAVLAPDRNIYSVKNMPAVAGGSAVDALRATPSVEVDANDNVSLRGNANVVVQINGRSTPLKGDQLAQFLKQIPATALDHIEVATNPSAKSDPEGTAGIINVVLKGDVDVGLSAGFNVGAGTSGMVNASGNVARQKGPLTLYGSLMYFQDRRNMTTQLDRTNLMSSTPASMHAFTDGQQHPKGIGSNLRGEYKFGKKDLVSAEAFLFHNNGFRDANSAYYEYDAQAAQVGQWDQASDTKNHFNSRDFSLTYRRTSSPQLTPFISEVHYSKFAFDQDNSVVASIAQQDSGSSNFRAGAQRDLTTNAFPTWVWQNDYTKPFGESFKLEAGTKSTWRETKSGQTSWRTDTTSGQLVARPDLGSQFDYNENFNAVYGVFSEQAGPVSLQEGLRVEQTATHFTLTDIGNGGADVKRNYTSLFPSAIATYNFSQTRLAKISYARRLSRPWPGSLSPVPFRVDQRNVQVGNPNLQPEYTDAYEITLQDAQPWGVVQLTPYVRQTNNAVRQIRTIDTSGVATSMPQNVARVRTAGTDVSLMLHHGPFSLNLGGSAYHYTSDAGALGAGYSVTTDAWDARANGSVKLAKSTTFQFFSFYRPAIRQEGGTSLANGFAGVGVRQQFDGGKGSVTLNIRDPFAWQRFGTKLDNGAVVEYNETRFQSRAVMLMFSHTFGQEVKLHPRETGADAAPTDVPGTPPSK